MAITNVFYLNANKMMGSLELDFLHAPVQVNANIDGTSDYSYNVSSLVDISTGRIGVNFTRAFADTNFVTMNTNQVGQVSEQVQDSTNLSTTRADYFSISAGATFLDPTEWNIYMIGHVTI